MVVVFVAFVAVAVVVVLVAATNHRNPSFAKHDRLNLINYVSHLIAVEIAVV